MDKKGGRDLRVQGMDAEEKDIQQGDAVKSCCIQCSLYCFALLGEGYSCCRRPFFLFPRTTLGKQVRRMDAIAAVGQWRQIRACTTRVMRGFDPPSQPVGKKLQERAATH